MINFDSTIWNRLSLDVKIFVTSGTFNKCLLKIHLLQCFDTVGWVTGKASDLAQEILKCFFENLWWPGPGDWLERLVSEITYNVLMGTLNPTHLFTVLYCWNSWRVQLSWGDCSTSHCLHPSGRPWLTCWRRLCQKKFQRLASIRRCLQGSRSWYTVTIAVNQWTVIILWSSTMNQYLTVILSFMLLHAP